VKARQITTNFDFGKIGQIEHGILDNKCHADPLNNVQGRRLFLLMKGI